MESQRESAARIDLQGRRPLSTSPATYLLSPDELKGQQLIHKVRGCLLGQTCLVGDPRPGYRSVDADCLEDDPQVDQLCFDAVGGAEKHGYSRSRFSQSR